MLLVHSTQSKRHKLCTPVSLSVSNSVELDTTSRACTVPTPMWGGDMLKVRLRDGGLCDGVPDREEEVLSSSRVPGSSSPDSSVP